jgi:hypothetical protein
VWRGGGVEMENEVVAEPRTMRAVVHGGGGVAVASDDGLASAAPYIELGFGGFWRICRRQ